MMVGADIFTCPPARRARRRPADPCVAAENAEVRESGESRENAENGETPENGEKAENAENRENLKTVKTRIAGKTARPLPHAPAAPRAETLKRETPETLKHETPRASRGGGETVKHAPARPRGIAPRTTCETVKHHLKTQIREGLGCFTPNASAGFRETAPCRCAAARETVKHPAAPVPGAAAHAKARNGETAHNRETAENGEGHEARMARPGGWRRHSARCGALPRAIPAPAGYGAPLLLSRIYVSKVKQKGGGSSCFVNQSRFKQALRQ